MVPGAVSPRALGCWLVNALLAGSLPTCKRFDFVDFSVTKTVLMLVSRWMMKEGGCTYIAVLH